MTEYLVYLISMSFTPGPNVILSTANGSRKGFPRCLVLNLGMLSGIVVLDTICYFAVSYLVLFVGKIEFILRILGIVYLVWLAVSLFKKGTVGSTDDNGGFIKGFYLQFMNVKLYMMLVTSVSSFVLPIRTGMMQGYLISLISPAIAFISQCCWALFGVALTNVYSSHARLFNALFGLSLLVLAVSNTVSLF